MSKSLIFLIATSIFGLLTTLALVTTEPVVRDSYFWRKPLIGSVFSAVCIVGIIAAFRPNKCSERFETEETTKTSGNGVLLNHQIKGHHPACQRFSAHTIAFSTHVVCAACTGLALGAFLAILGTAIYIFAGNVPVETGQLMLIAGSVFVLLGFAQLKFKSSVRLALNAAFVAGAYLVLTGVDILVGNVLLDLYVISLIGLWIWTRIWLSEWDHARTCRSCKYKCVLGRS